MSPSLMIGYDQKITLLGPVPPPSAGSSLATLGSGDGMKKPACLGWALGQACMHGAAGPQVGRLAGSVTSLSLSDSAAVGAVAATTLEVSSTRKWPASCDRNAREPSTVTAIECVIRLKS